MKWFQREIGLKKWYVTYFFNIICPCALDHAPAELDTLLFFDDTPIEQQAPLSCGFVTGHLDVDVSLWVAFSLHKKVGVFFIKY